jgi:MarR-like DNA-binding transcriptional regulator SgrR of sgrS sRNA
LLGRSRLFPECDPGSGDCRKVKSVEDALTNKRERELLKELKAAEWAIEAIRNRFNSSHPAEKAHTKEEKEALRALLKSYTADKSRLQKELGIADKEKDKPGLFGPARTRRRATPPAHLEASHRRHAELQALSESIRKRLRSSDIAAKVYTEGERKVLLRLLAEAEDERKRIARDTGVVVRERGLF